MNYLLFHFIQVIEHPIHGNGKVWKWVVEFKYRPDSILSQRVLAYFRLHCEDHECKRVNSNLNINLANYLPPPSTALLSLHAVHNSGIWHLLSGHYLPS